MACLEEGALFPIPYRALCTARLPCDPHPLLPGGANRPGCRVEECSQGVPCCSPKVCSGFQAQGWALGLA